MTPLWRAALLSRFPCPSILLAVLPNIHILSKGYTTHPAICAGAREVIYRDPLSFKHKPQLHLTTPCPDRRLLLKRKIFGNGSQNMPRYSLGGDDREISI